MNETTDKNKDVSGKDILCIIICGIGIFLFLYGMVEAMLTPALEVPDEYCYAFWLGFTLVGASIALSVSGAKGFIISLGIASSITLMIMMLNDCEEEHRKDEFKGNVYTCINNELMEQKQGEDTFSRAFFHKDFENYKRNVKYCATFNLTESQKQELKSKEKIVINDYVFRDSGFTDVRKNNQPILELIGKNRLVNGAWVYEFLDIQQKN